MKTRKAQIHLEITKEQEAELLETRKTHYEEKKQDLNILLKTMNLTFNDFPLLLQRSILQEEDNGYIKMIVGAYMLVDKQARSILEKEPQDIQKEIIKDSILKILVFEHDINEKALLSVIQEEAEKMEERFNENGYQ